MLVVRSPGSGSLFLSTKCAVPLWQLLSRTPWEQMATLRHRMWTMLRRRHEFPSTDVNAKRWRALWHYPIDGKAEKHGEDTSLSNTRWGVEGVWQLPANPHPSSCFEVTWRQLSRDHWTHCLTLVVNDGFVSILHGYEDTGSQRFWGPDLGLFGSHVTS